MNRRTTRWRRLQRYVIRLPLPVRKFVDSVRWLRLRFQSQHYWFERASRQEFFRRAFVALAFNKIDGDYTEFGSHGGLTFNLAYQASKRVHPCMLWAFDSFQGLPPQGTYQDEHPAWVQGAMHTELDEFHFLCEYNGIPRSVYQVVPGYYEVTLAPNTSNENLPKDICLAYIDCDLYSSTMAVLEFLKPRLKHGMILAFDDYYCWSASQVSGERRAMTEIFADDTDWRLLPFVQYGWGGMSFVVEARKLMKSSPIGY